MATTFLKKKKPSGDMALQITSMADIFMILLVFLLKSYSTNLANISPTKNIKLPVAASKDTLKDTLKLEISSDAILVDGKEILRLNNHQINPGEISDDGYSGPLYKILMEQRQKLPDPNLDPNLLILADERTPYDTIKRVLASAANSGFVDLQLMVVQNQ